jgi:hypothetical protein
MKSIIVGVLTLAIISASASAATMQERVEPRK